MLYEDSILFLAFATAGRYPLGAGGFTLLHNPENFYGSVCCFTVIILPENFYFYLYDLEFIGLPKSAD